MKSNIFQGKDTEINNTCICVVVQMLNSKALLVQICHFVVWILFMLPCTSCRKEIVDEQYDINVNGNTYFKIIEKINIQPCLLLFSLKQPPKRGVWQDIFHFLWGIWSLKDINIGGCCEN